MCICVYLSACVCMCVHACLCVCVHEDQKKALDPWKVELLSFVNCTV